MAGLAGIIGNPDMEKLQRILSKLNHRGAAGEDYFITPSVSLSYLFNKINRMFKNDTTCVAIDGDIYNHSPENILQQYQDKGPACVSDWDGEFIVVIIDSSSVFIARDRLGIKPLYYVVDGNSFYFASEIKAITEINKKIQEFPPAHYFIFSKNNFVNYWQINKKQANLSNINDIIISLRETLANAVGKRLDKSTRMGVFLSGGIDSSIIAYLASQISDNILFFSAGMEGSDDLKYAEELSDFLKIKHYKYVYTLPRMLEVLPKVIYHLESFDAPLVRSSIPNYLVTKLASEYVNTVLIGEGGDELFAGYDFLKNYTTDRLHQELLSIISTLHNTGLQRCDRIPFSSSVDAKIPFLDIQVINLAMQINPELKLYGLDKVEKWILRKTFEDVLPKNIVWRTKQKFSAGAGSMEVINDWVENQISDEDFAQNKTIIEKYKIHSKEELYYFRIFSNYFNPEMVLSCIGRTEHF